MKIEHGDYLTYEIPEKWIVEEDEDNTVIYDNDGEGALVVSFYTIKELENTLDEHISVMAKKFIDNNTIKLENSFILQSREKNEKILYGVGKTLNNDFFKIWIIAKYPKVIVATYESEKKTSEINCINKIINSFEFNNLD